MYANETGLLIIILTVNKILILCFQVWNSTSYMCRSKVLIRFDPHLKLQPQPVTTAKICTLETYRILLTNVTPQ